MIGPFSWNPSAPARGLSFALTVIFFTMMGMASGSRLGPTAVDAAANPSSPLQVLRITPSGEEVPPGQQLTLEFNLPMVPLGRMERDASEVPVAIEPPIRCQWQWINEKTLSCRLREGDRLRPATRYTLTVSPHIAGLGGVKPAGEISHSFTTERPRVADVWFREWTAPGKPVFFLRFNQPVSLESIEDHLYFLPGGRPRIPASALPPEDDGASPRTEALEWVATPRDDLPADTPVELKVEPGIVSAAGPLPGQEKRTLSSFHTFPPFNFLGIECTGLTGKKIRIRPSAASENPPRCNPTLDVNLLFTSPVLPEGVKGGVVIASPGSPEGFFDDLQEKWESLETGSHLHILRQKGQAYPLPLPGDVVRPWAAYHVKIPPEILRDEFGRALRASAGGHFRTDHLPPDYALAKTMPVLEKGLDTEAHLWAVNIEKASLGYDVLTAQGRIPGLRKSLPLPIQKDQESAVPLGVRDLLAHPSGVVQGTVSPVPPLAGKSPSQGWFFAQVTPFQVHVKLGHHNSLVWVTDLQSGLPVHHVQVEIRRDTFPRLGEGREVLSVGTTDERGLAVLGGTAQLDPKLSMLWSYEQEEPGLFVFCQKEGDMAVVPLRYDFHVAAEGANRQYIPEWMRPLHGHMRAWGATAQGIYKAGDTIQYKIYVRNQDNERFTAPPSSMYALKILDPMGKSVHERQGIELSSFGAFHGEWTVPPNGAVGHYRFALSADFTDEQWDPLQVLVSDFTPSAFKVTTTLDGEGFEAEDSVKVASEAHLHAGGPYSGAAVRILGRVESRVFDPPNPVLKGYRFDSILSEGEEAVSTFENVADFRGRLNDQGRADWELQLPGGPIIFGVLSVESAVQDERGRSVAHAATAPYTGRDRFVGALQEDWTLGENQPASLKLAVVDKEGRLLPQVKVNFKLQSRRTLASRVKGPGDAYLTQYVHEWVDEEQREAVSGEEPVALEFVPQKPGLCRMTLEILDSRGRPHSTSITRWVVGRGQVVWESLPGFTMNVFPEKEELKVGDTARFLVQNPYPGARALITVERFGILRSWTQTLETGTEVVELPVTAELLPGFYFSVLVTSPRVDRPVSPEGLDLGKPSFRMGYAQVRVRDSYKEISVEATPDKEVYKPGETVTVNLQARLRNPPEGSEPPPMELAVAVLDESVFQLLHKGRRNFDPYEGFYQLDDLDVRNFNLLMNLVGREKLEKKGASAGGDGGADIGLRSLFKFVCHWDPSIIPDGEGRSQIRFTLPDNLTAYRILTLAVTPDDRMGLGERLFRVNRPTEIRSLLPNQVMEGDRFDALFTVMNRTEEQRSLEVILMSEGAIASPDDDRERQAQRMLSHQEAFSLEPYGRRMVKLPMRVTAPGDITFSVRAGDEKDRDGLRTRLKALPRRSLEHVSIHATTDESQVTRPVELPANMRGDEGFLRIMVSPSILGNLEGPFSHLRDYPFTCWEQKLSRGIMAAFHEKLSPYLSRDFQWEGVASLPNEVIAAATAYQAPNGGMTYFVPRDEYADPFLSAFTALGLLWLENLGYAPDPPMSRKLDEYLQRLLRRDEFPPHYSKGMTATVRSVALAALVGKGTIQAADAQRFEHQVKWMDLFARALYLETLTRVEGTEHLQKSVLQSILNHADAGGTSLTFSESADSGFQALLHSPTRRNAAILSALLAYANLNPSDTSVSDLAARLARTVADGRDPSGRWPSTQDNLFAVKALLDYSRTFEKDPPEMEVQAWLDAEPIGHARFSSFFQEPIALERPLRPEDIGNRRRLSIGRTGEGRLFYGVHLAYAPEKPDQKQVNNGLEIHREYSIERDGHRTLLPSPMEVATGELVRVDIFVHVPVERYFVVVEDPVPGALEPVNRDLATSVSLPEDDGGRHPEGSHGNLFRDWVEPGPSRWNFYHRELRHEAVRFYSEMLPAGRYHLSYVAQAVAPGEFGILPARAEEMYHPDVYGKTEPSALKVTLSEGGASRDGGP